MRRLAAQAVTAIGRFAESRHGGIVPMAAAGVPLLAILAIAASELASLSADKRTMQDAADAVALDGANQLMFATMAGVEERMAASAQAKLSDLAARSELTAQVTKVEGGQGIQVALVSRRTSFFGNMLPPGGFVTSVRSTALKMPTVPLCVLAYADEANTIRLGGSADVNAPKCLVHSNKEIRVEESSKLSAIMVQAGEKAEGAISPAPQVGAEPLKDPFAGIPITVPATRCDDLNGNSGNRSNLKLKAGKYCEPMIIGAGQTLTLGQGSYWFTGGLVLQGNAELKGVGATLFFSKDAKLEIKDQARVDLEGPRTGAWAGFLIVAARDNTNDFSITADNVDRLLGTVYIPEAKLLVDGHSTVAEDSDWTILVARTIEVRGSSKLVVNADYARSGVPTPPGVGQKHYAGRNVRLMQ